LPETPFSLPFRSLVVEPVEGIKRSQETSAIHPR
jgi:hypothetical protein